MRRYQFRGVPFGFAMIVAGTALLLFGAALTLSACGDDDDNASAAQSGSTSQDGTGNTAAMLAALYISDNAGLHDMDDELNQPGGGAINARWLGAVQHAQVAVASAQWPEELQAKALHFREAAQRLADAIARDDAAAAARPAKDAHDTQHELSVDGWAYLAERAGVDLGDDSHAAPTATAQR